MADDIAYVPTMTTNPSDAEITEAFATPPYDDVGVSYKGYSKTKVSGSRWQLNRQETRFVILHLKNGDFGSVLFDRPNPDKTFYCTKAILIHRAPGAYSYSLAQMRIADVDKDNHASTKLYYWAQSDTQGAITFDFSDCPRKFTGNRFDLYTDYSFAGPEYLVVQLFGWEE